VETIRAREDFDAARFKAFRRAVTAALTRRRGRLLSLDEVLEAAGAEGRSFGGIQPLFFVRIIGPPGVPSPARFPDIMLFISLSFPIIPIPPTARIMSRAVVNCLMKALTSCG